MRSFPWNSTLVNLKVSFTENSIREFYTSWKFNLRIRLKDNFTRKSIKLNESWNFSMKPQKLFKFKGLCFPDILSQIIPANYTKFCNALSYSFHLFFFFLYIEFVSKTLLSVLSFESVSEQGKLWNLLFKIIH